jgi:hypothetical protein
MILAAALLAALSSLSSAQERPVPKDSARLSIAGCARGRVFTVGRDPKSESLGFQLAEGMKIRLEGQKKALEEIKAHEGAMIELTGLMMPNGRGMGAATPVLDVEAWRPLNSSCPKR